MVQKPGKYIMYCGNGCFLAARQLEKMEELFAEVVENTPTVFSGMISFKFKCFGKLVKMFVETELPELEFIKGWKNCPNPLYAKKVGFFTGE